MQRFSRALEVPGGDRIGIRLAIAQIFIRQGHPMMPVVQIALGFAEARLFPDSPVTAEDFAGRRESLSAMHDFDLAENYFTKAQLAGANNRSVAIGLTNTYLAEGDTRKAEKALASLGPAAISRRLRLHDGVGQSVPSAAGSSALLSAFAQASTVAGAEDHGMAESSQYTEGEQAGHARSTSA